VTARSLGLYTYSTQPRGSVVHAAYLAEALHEAGWDVTLYALEKDRSGFFRPLSAPLCLVPASATPPTTAELVQVRRRELADFVRRHALHHDLHHAQDCLTATALLDLRDRGHRLWVVRTVHHVERFEDPYLAACQERSIREADLCLTVSEAAERDVARVFGVQAHRVGNGVAVNRFAQVERWRLDAWRRRLGIGRGPLVLAVGGIEERKNTVRLLQAFARLHAQEVGARLCILGGASVLDHGKYRALFDAVLAELPAPTREAVTELGVIGDDEVPSLFQVSNVLALPSLHEGFGLAALEALAAGTPVVTSRQPPFTEFLDDTCAVLVDPEDEAALAAGLEEALASGSVRREAGRRRAERHSWQRVAAMHAQHYTLSRRTDARNALRRSLA